MQYPVVGGGHELAVMVGGAAAVRQRVVVGREDALGPTAPRSRPVSRSRPTTTAGGRRPHRGQDGRLGGDAVGVPVGQVAVERGGRGGLRLHRHRDGGQGVLAARPAAAMADVEGVLEAPPHVVLFAAVDHEAGEGKTEDYISVRAHEYTSIESK